MANLWLRVQLLGEKGNHIQLYAGHYLLVISLIIGLGLQLSIVNM